MSRSLPSAVENMLSRASEDAQSDVVPFWRLDGEGVIQEGMFQLTSELDLPTTEELFATLSVGYRLVFSNFNREQSRAGEGFATGVESCGGELVAAAAQTYQEIEMYGEVRALRRVLAQYRHAKALSRVGTLCTASSRMP